MPHCSLHWLGRIGLSLVLFRVLGSYRSALIGLSVVAVVLPVLHSPFLKLRWLVPIGEGLIGQFDFFEFRC